MNANFEPVFRITEIAEASGISRMTLSRLFIFMPLVCVPVVSQAWAMFTVVLIFSLMGVRADLLLAKTVFSIHSSAGAACTAFPMVGHHAEHISWQVFSAFFK